MTREGRGCIVRLARDKMLHLHLKANNSKNSSSSRSRSRSGKVLGWCLLSSSYWETKTVSAPRCHSDGPDD